MIKAIAIARPPRIVMRGPLIPNCQLRTSFFSLCLLWGSCKFFPASVALKSAETKAIFPWLQNVSPERKRTYVRTHVRKCRYKVWLPSSTDTKLTISLPWSEPRAPIDCRVLLCGATKTTIHWDLRS